MQLDIDLPPAGSRQRMAALHQQLRTAILDGRLAPGTRLPTTRELAQTLAVSRNTAVSVYERLMSEGYIESRQRQGCFVGSLVPGRSKTSAPASRGPDRISLPDAWRTVGAWSEEPLLPSPRHDFRVGLPDHSQLPWDAWRRLANRVQRDFARSPKAYTDPRGDPALREAIAGHVSFTRAVACTADDVIVTSGARHALALLADALVTPGRTMVAVEDPGYSAARMSMSLRGALVQPIALDDEGLRVDQLPPRTGIVCVTPSHQFPVGMPMSLNRRAQLLEFARRQRAVVIEDDYDAEFRYGARPLDALHSLDKRGVVFYVGTFSKVLFPALRVGFIVAPAWARERLCALLHATHGAPPLLTQLALASFIREGHLARHVRRMTRIYGRRRELLLEGMARHAGGVLQPVDSTAGLHVSALLPKSIDARRVVEAAGREGLAMQALHAGRGRPSRNGIAFGLGLVRDDRIDAGMRLLASLLRSHA